MKPIFIERQMRCLKKHDNFDCYGASCVLYTFDVIIIEFIVLSMIDQELHNQV